MTDTAPKPAHWKGQSRVNKECHWQCGKKQEPGVKPFQACSRCKEVFYCSKECQVKSWPLHKAPCKSSTELRAKLASRPGAETEVARFKKWHSFHTTLFRQAVVSALDLGNTPSNADTKALLLEVELKPDHESLPPSRKYRVKGGFCLMLKEARDMLSNVGGATLLNSSLEAHAHMKKKGGLDGAKKMQNATDIGDMWVEWLAASLETEYDTVPVPQ